MGFYRRALGVTKVAPLILVMMGGDGGLMMALSQLREIVDIQKFIFVSLPFGSGNDMAQAQNWGSDTSLPYIKEMR